MSKWLSKPLGKTVTFQKGRKVETSAEELPGYLRYLGAGSLVGKNDGYASTVNAVRATSKDVLMLWDGERSGLVGYNLEGVVSSTVSKLATLGEVTAPYLYYFLSRNFEWIQNRRTGTGVPHVPKDLGRIMIVNFPKCEDTQKQITTILQTIDEAIEQTEALIEKYSLVKAGMMHDLFTRGLTPDGKLRPSREEAPELYKETLIGWLPLEWDLKPLGSMSKIASGITLNSKSEPAQSVSVPYLRVANVQDGYLDLAEMKEIRVSKEAVARYALQEGDVLMNEGGDFDKLGRGTVWPGDIDPCIHQNHVFRVRTEKQILRPYFLTFWSQSNHGKKYFLLSSKQSTNLASINSKQLNAYPIGVPTTDEQSEIEIRITSVNSKLETLEHEKHKLLVQKSGLMHDLLTGEVPVNVAEPEAANV
ncbi:restriction endonuclease subunit S [Jannaschia sp. M317]|uniref:restriction endonuclease subunit S n=1 Tax=Jannaschia sp. M317 TaxID=2867011 RepID=UPI0021A5F1D7|nr:restriction endonuclease subunit S [Jannaschia sp. M317]UWQ19063.1 restriction endonuclease subunit S [Jannaschia sp. M317]